MFLLSTRLRTSRDTHLQKCKHVKDNFKKLTKLKQYFNPFNKELRSFDFSFLIKIRRTNVNPCRILFAQQILFFNIFLSFGKKIF